jgi:hypothetical protein
MVSHFSDWNCDTPEGTATVRGLVVDCNNLPVPGINVKIGQASANTGSDGKFERRVPANTAFEVQVLGNSNFGLTSQPVSVPALNEGNTHDVGTLSVQCPAYVTGIIKCGTDVKFGQVVISWNGGYNSQYTDATGKFNIPTDLNKSAELSIYTFDGNYKKINITTPSVPGGVNDLGVIEVCDAVVIGENKFTVNGGGFTNRTFTFTADTQRVWGFYSPNDSLTFIYMVEQFASDSIAFWLSFKGIGLGAQTDVNMYFLHNSQYFIGSSFLPNSSPMVNITKYSGVGGLIEGTFSATLFDVLGGTGASLTISSGKFSVIRLISGTQNEKLLKDKIPIEIRKKYNIK